MAMLKGYLGGLKNIFLPALCFSCESKIADGYLCQNCLQKIEFLYPPLCRTCAKPIDNNKTGLCANCRGKTFAYERLICVTSYQEPISSLIHFFKYKNYECLIDLFSSLMIKHLAKIGLNYSSYDFATAVPMYAAKQRDRGYNQAVLLAKSLANYFEIPFKDGIIYESYEKVSQTKLVSSRRRENVKGAFYVKESISGKKILLIDDIFTTGATVGECAGALKENGAREVTIITLSKTPQGGLAG